eukprot:CAMPEP_0182543916 /NCGR_PEP_ID=MMETSP1323-20130603/32357_1 /TAXON_ID=236787 /ORGANISM="Florenciella parvula, Strain RCC1693" /LENGTH=192 /DNA_ID=CAMNT_0024754901 /DNA_START=49 /DNA_END=627 /DNA_ORIENTATION=-
MKAVVKAATGELKASFAAFRCSWELALLLPVLIIVLTILSEVGDLLHHIDHLLHLLLGDSEHVIVFPLDVLHLLEQLIAQGHCDLLHVPLFEEVLDLHGLYTASRVVNGGRGSRSGRGGPSGGTGTRGAKILSGGRYLHVFVLDEQDLGNDHDAGGHAHTHADGKRGDQELRLERALNGEGHRHGDKGEQRD